MDNSSLEKLQSQLGTFIDPPLILSNAHDVHVQTVDGRTLIDLCSGYWLVSLGYGNSEIIDEMTAAARELSYAHLFHFAHPAAIQLADKLVALTSEANFKKVLFANSGSGAIEIALHLAARYAQMKGLKKPTLAYLERGYHGSTFIEQSLTTYRHYPTNFRLAQSFHAVTSPKDEISAQRSLEELQRLASSSELAALICEPIQGVGGVIVPPTWYFPEVRRICSDNDILLIFDEISTGLGVTGKWFGFQSVGAVPDIIALGKRLGGGYFPISTVLANEKLLGVLHQGFDHGHATSGHPVGCKVALKIIEILERDDLVAQAGRLGHYLHRKLSESFSPLFGEGSVSGIGLMQSVDVSSSKIARSIQLEGINRGVLFINEGRFMVLCPSFNISIAQLSLALDNLITAAISAQPHARMHRTTGNALGSIL